MLKEMVGLDMGISTPTHVQNPERQCVYMNVPYDFIHFTMKINLHRLENSWRQAIHHREYFISFIFVQLMLSFSGNANQLSEGMQLQSVTPE